ncbi:MAG: histidine kinase, partial [Calditrichaeota bacterium]|nr:histidine kinase [Calditrichota bacterium]
DWQLILGIHIALALGFALAHALLLNLSAWLFWPASTAAAGLRESEFLPLLLRNVHFDFLIYWLIAGGGYALEFYQRYRERELRAAQLENQLFAAQLQVLKSQIHPHFLFNTLHTVSALMYQDVQLADKVITRLSELLRLTLDNASLQFVNLGRELDFLKLYLEIMKTRYPDRLEIHLDIAPETLDAEVPYLILQPLVENAIQHGRTRERKVHEVRISARRERNCLKLDVSDNGPGFPEAAQGVFEKGIGLSNTSRRLLQIYGSAQRFILHHKKGGGVVVTLILPYRRKSNQSPQSQGSENVKDKNPDR